ncbi:MAG TPA: Fur family transcriptional regulator [Gammaproteobacteria bacterium]
MKALSGSFGLDRRAVTERLQAHGIKPTRQRVLLAQFLFQRPQHVTADGVFAAVNAERDLVSKATVYNTLHLFVQQGLVREVLVDRERAFYDSNTSAHHHLFCEDDSQLTDVPGDVFEVRGSPQLPDGVEVIGTEVIVRVRRRPGGAAG